MKENRIYFKGNPWPDGHKIKNFSWITKIKDDEVWFHFTLESEDYYAEFDHYDDPDYDEDQDYESSWNAPGVWGNYHSCRISSNFWHDGGFKVCNVKEYSAEYIDGLEITVDPDPESFEDFEDMAFHIYLLGHDAVGNHKIKFTRIGETDHFNIEWNGNIALAYVGDYDFDYEFKTFITDVKIPELS